ncbi:MAG TPA: hypothetical protein VMR34_01140 [Candidatus Saccharimonadales bacterium]|nr:hypothetical protein [Candidatus Saccharimonadales bacterium]
MDTHTSFVGHIVAVLLVVLVAIGIIPVIPSVTKSDQSSRIVSAESSGSTDQTTQTKNQTNTKNLILTSEKTNIPSSGSGSSGGAMQDVLSYLKQVFAGFMRVSKIAVVLAADTFRIIFNPTRSQR